MLKKLAPFFAVLLSVLLDTSIIHVFYHGVYLIPLSLIMVLLISALCGRTQGVLCGMIAGLIMDVTTGSLGLKLFGYIAIGFLMGFLLYGQNPHEADRNTRISNMISRAVWTFVLVGLYEIVMFVYQYFCTAVFEWVFVQHMLVRLCAVVLLFTLLFPLFRRIFLGKASRFDQAQTTREVKNF